MTEKAKRTVRLIDANAIKFKKLWWRNPDGEEFEWEIADRFEIDQEPTIDEVIRCSECRYNTDNPRLFYSKDMVATYAWCQAIKEATSGRGYCSFAKGEEEEE